MSSDTPIFSLKNRWFTGSVAILLLIAAAAAAIGLVAVPRTHARDTMASLWEAICRAAGAPAPYQSAALPEEERFPTSVVVTAQMMAPADARSIGTGATLAMACTMCHGARGTSPAGTPHLAGQPATSTYKQLRDFKSGHRQSVIMAPLVARLSDQDMRDLADYYASLHLERTTPFEPVDQATPRLVRNGAPMRSIGACASCHSQNAVRPATPVLEGQPESYLRDQLHAFRAGTRGNDINRQMRNAAIRLTDKEIDELAGYYASR